MGEGSAQCEFNIGNQVWMAENLNYRTSRGSWCYDDQNANCEKYGRLYTWETAKRVCLAGWHLPSDREWTVLTRYLGVKDAAKKCIKKGLLINEETF